MARFRKANQLIWIITTLFLFNCATIFFATAGKTMGSGIDHFSKFSFSKKNCKLTDIEYFPKREILYEFRLKEIGTGTGFFADIALLIQYNIANPNPYSIVGGFIYFWGSVFTVAAMNSDSYPMYLEKYSKNSSYWMEDSKCKNKVFIINYSFQLNPRLLYSGITLMERDKLCKIESEKLGRIQNRMELEEIINKIAPEMHLNQEYSNMLRNPNMISLTTNEIFFHIMDRISIDDIIDKCYLRIIFIE
ncbi:MAG: hypothetical protein SFU98_11265 [Leptospiraceae bacterium]|nr:hypothetical protein [Leptospiraceae bacterium]